MEAISIRPLLAPYDLFLTRFDLDLANAIAVRLGRELIRSPDHRPWPVTVGALENCVEISQSFTANTSPSPLRLGNRNCPPYVRGNIMAGGHTSVGVRGVSMNPNLEISPCGR